MSVNIEDLYRHMYEEHRFASEIRLKIIAGWFAIYVALSVAFGWAIQHYPKYTWFISIAAAITTLIMWLADIRNRAAIRSPKVIGDAIENDPRAGIPESQRFFASLEKGFSHSRLIDYLSIILLILLIYASWYLWYNSGVIPGSLPMPKA